MDVSLDFSCWALTEREVLDSADRKPNLNSETRHSTPKRTWLPGLQTSYDFRVRLNRKHHPSCRVCRCSDPKGLFWCQNAFPEFTLVVSSATRVHDHHVENACNLSQKSTHHQRDTGQLLLGYSISGCGLWWRNWSVSRNLA